MKTKLLGVVLFTSLAACSAAPDEVSDPPSAGNEPVASTEEALASCHRYTTIFPQTRDADRYMLERALEWVDDKVMYSQAPPYHDGWRRDCSGLVSMAWKLTNTKPGLVTWTMHNRSHEIAWKDLRPGDALNIPHHHVMLFAGWTNKNEQKACVIEEYDYGHPAEIRLRTRSDLMAQGYQPIRRDQ
jgi:hypothetical protein